MLLADVVAASAAVGATRSRTAKTATLAALLRAAAPEEVEPATAWLSGEPRQGRIGAGWRTLAALDAARRRTRRRCRSPRSTPRSTRWPPRPGQGSAARRAALLGELFGAATGDEQAFLRRLLTGELRQGALEGVMLEAIAAAAAVPAAAVRRAFMLSGPPARDGRPRTHRRASTRSPPCRCRSDGRSGRCSPPRPTRSTPRSPSWAPT